MKSKKKIVFNFLLILLFIGIALMSCEKRDNQVLNYFENAEMQYKGKIQQENIITALNDILSLSEEQLKTQTYQDYAGKDNQWDLPTLIYRHFVPSEKGKSLGNNFYHDVKSKNVQEKLEWFLRNVEQFELEQ